MAPRDYASLSIILRIDLTSSLSRFSGTRQIRRSARDHATILETEVPSSSQIRLKNLQILCPTCPIDD